MKRKCEAEGIAIKISFGAKVEYKKQRNFYGDELFPIERSSDPPEADLLNAVARNAIRSEKISKERIDPTKKDGFCKYEKAPVGKPFLIRKWFFGNQLKIYEIGVSGGFAILLAMGVFEYHRGQWSQIPTTGRIVLPERVGLTHYPQTHYGLAGGVGSARCARRGCHLWWLLKRCGS